ncbi:hypothetical protein L9F63_022908, partial [Diploptera punctata]
MFLGDLKPYSVKSSVFSRPLLCYVMFFLNRFRDFIRFHPHMFSVYFIFNIINFVSTPFTAGVTMMILKKISGLDCAPMLSYMFLVIALLFV